MFSNYTDHYRRLLFALLAMLLLYFDFLKPFDLDRPD